jgi:hypothetical protein
MVLPVMTEAEPLPAEEAKTVSLWSVPLKTEYDGYVGRDRSFFELPHGRWKLSPENGEYGCVFPSDGRIRNLGISILGTTREGERRLISWEREKDYLILLIVSKTPKEDRGKLIGAISRETRYRDGN